MHRRAFVTGTLAALSLGSCRRAPGSPAGVPVVDSRFAALAGFCDGLAPIGDDERARRRERAQALMQEHGLSAMLFEPGDSLTYFAGIRWGRSERPMLYLLPARGAAALVAPAFESRTLAERAGDGLAQHLWHEHESPFSKLAEALRAAGVERGKLGVDPWIRQFIVDGARAACEVEIAPATDVLRGCRMIKSASELALLRRANEASKAALKAVSAHVSEGMSEGQLAELVHAAQTAAGLADTWVLALFGANASFPHGTQGEKRLVRGELVLVDAGGSLHGYQSDVTRTWPFGPVSSAQARAWQAVHRAQTAALAELRPGRPCDAADAAARAAIAAAGYAADYGNFTHRLGHGIGLQTHEDPYLVRGNRYLLRPGMTMSDEPGVYLVGELGVRLEDIVAITDGEPEVFGPRAGSIEAPFG
ncbi:M24 family metallopeptidase [Nannocystis bainbridge]|uniref:Xaa-Pro peptidase family protein n=1 Tax=Nannocystis bainbridge TaxID=2995303 RepID=A0ABT5DRJ5_9BACT|nr:Xaa-Pro peptidase family protein [Nannocystis bainbridge]MDC0716277.1 Xaa-Pro peptidase family protein [Nannocystis bainbridge]